MTCFLGTVWLVLAADTAAAKLLECPCCSAIVRCSPECVTLNSEQDLSGTYPRIPHNCDLFEVVTHICFVKGPSELCC